MPIWQEMTHPSWSISVEINNSLALFKKYCFLWPFWFFLRLAILAEVTSWSSWFLITNSKRQLSTSSAILKKIKAKLQPWECIIGKIQNGRNDAIRAKFSKWEKNNFVPSFIKIGFIVWTIRGYDKHTDRQGSPGFNIFSPDMTEYKQGHLLLVNISLGKHLGVPTLSTDNQRRIKVLKDESFAYPVKEKRGTQSLRRCSRCSRCSC